MNSPFENDPISPSQKLKDDVWLLIKPLLETDEFELNKKAHVEYLQAALNKEYGTEYLGFDVIRPWMCFWTAHSLEILEAPFDMNAFVTTISSYQNVTGGFGGKSGIASHLACTYASLATLCMLDDPNAYSLINTSALKEFLLMMKRPDGTFHLYEEGEYDVRGIYCALVSAYLTDTLDEHVASGCMERIWKCQTWEGGFGSHPKCEAHGGYTFCAVAVLSILECLYPRELVWSGVDVAKLVEYCVSLQCERSGGFAGRTNKLVDGCYSFWLAGTLQILDSFVTTTGKVNFRQEALKKFILNVCQTNNNTSDNSDARGGLRDKPGKKPDLYHTCYCLSGLALVVSEELIELDPVFNVGKGKPERMRAYFKSLKCFN